MEERLKKQLCEMALDARKNAYVPYSHFSVGAALLGADGTIYTGCNVENASYPAGICAERNAIFHAVADGCRRFTAIAVAGGAADAEPKVYAMPCGICRQVMSEFCGSDFIVLVVKNMSEIREYTLSDLLPHAFDPSSLK